MCSTRALAIGRGAACALALAAVACSSNITSKSAVGSVCAGNAACASDLCLQVDSSTSLCTEACKKDSDCPSQYLCSQVGTGGDYCLPVGLDGVCRNDNECAAGFKCDTTAGHCYIPITDRQLCDPCTSDSQCSKVNGVGGICRADGSGFTCTQDCKTQACPTNYTCKTVTGSSDPQCVPNNDANTCSPDLGLCASCQSDFECGPNNNCVQNLASKEQFCATGCKQNTDCPTNFTCTDLSGIGSGPNVCVPNSGTCVGYCDGTDADTVLRECGLDATCDLSSRKCVQKSDGSLCAACNTDDDCSSMGNSCLENQCTDCPFKGQKFCSNSCTTGDAMACPLGFTCGALGNSVGAPAFCLPNSGSCETGQGAIGDNCSADGPSQCASGICLGLGLQSVCSVSCTMTSDCGRADFQCCALSDNGSTYDCSQTPGGSGGICAPLGGAAGADCSAGSPPCDDGVCLDLGTANVCSVLCTSDTDCTSAGLTGFSCDNAEQPNGDGTSSAVKVCFPPGGGAVGVNCDFGPAECASGLCLKANGGNFCTQKCTSAASCPTGYACKKETLVNGSTSSATFCVPPNL